MPDLTKLRAKVQLASPIAPKNNLTVEQLTKDQREIFSLGANTTSTTDIEVYYVADIEINKTHPRGFSFPKDWIIDATVASQINDSIFMPSSSKYYTLAHEMMHILLQVSLHPKKPTVLLAGASTEVFVEARTLITDTKRLDDINTRTILASKYVAQPE